MDLGEIFKEEMSLSEKLIITNLIWFGECEYDFLQKRLGIKETYYRKLIDRCYNKNFLMYRNRDNKGSSM